MLLAEVYKMAKEIFQEIEIVCLYLMTDLNWKSYLRNIQSTKLHAEFKRLNKMIISNAMSFYLTPWLLWAPIGA